MLPLALIISEIFSPTSGQLELDLDFLPGKIWTVGECPPNLKKFSKMVVVPLCPLEHDLVLKEQKGDNLKTGAGVSVGGAGGLENGGGGRGGAVCLN